MRGWAAIAVLAGHANQIIVGPTTQAFQPLFGLLAQAAVMMFFVLSGFLICKTITRNKTRNGTFDARAYAVDRFNRIMPPLAFSILVVAVLWVLAPLVFPTGTHQFAAKYPFSARPGFDVDLKDVLGSAMFVNGFLTDSIAANGPLWSLSYEVWYYVAAGLVAALPLRFGVPAALIVLGVLCISTRTFVMYSAVWFAGAVVALTPAYDRRLGALAVVGGAVALVAAAVLGFIYARSGIGASEPGQLAGWTIRYYNVFLGMFFAAVLYHLVHGRISLPVFAPGTADFSYTLYIVHFPILLVVYGVLQPHIHGNALASWVVAGVSAVAVLIFARWAAGWVEHLKPIGPRALADAPAVLRR